MSEQSNIFKWNEHAKASDFKGIAKIILGNVFLGLAYAKWMKPNNIINGGVTSLAMIFEKASGIPILWLTNGFTLILLCVCLLFLGKENFFKSILSSICYNLFFSLFYLSPLNFSVNIIVDFIFASFVIALGYYCCISANASTVGMDVIALVINKHNPNFSIANGIRTINFIVLAFGFFVYGWKSIVIGIAFSFVHSYLLGKMLSYKRAVSLGD
ncbi:YitT family protein [Enterococcus songbeiensis]|uniref:YitT family protein n=1 Tax=Enterococcus songbeiensis TaxID=2559927 RepID=UPI001FE747B8|nr:YitT family protein [Enterococcus songbeiensis]